MNKWRQLSYKEQLFFSIIIFLSVIALVVISVKMTGCTGEFTGPEVYISDYTEYIQVSAGMTHTLALKADGTVDCWFDPSFNYRQCDFPEDEEYTYVSAGLVHSCLITIDGDLICVGCYGDEILGLIDVPTGPCEIGSPHNVVTVSAGFDTTLAINALNKLICWGNCSNADDVSYETSLDVEQSLPLVVDGNEELLLVGEYI